MKPLKVALSIPEVTTPDLKSAQKEDDNLRRCGTRPNLEGDRTCVAVDTPRWRYGKES